MASNSGAVILVVLGLVAVGLAADRDGHSETGGTEGADVGATQVDVGHARTCDGVVVVQTASARAQVPGGATRTKSSVDCNMGEGSGDKRAVRALQKALVTCNGQHIAIDGTFGQQTRQAVARVQAQDGVAADGTYNVETRKAMKWPATSASGTTTCVSKVSSSTASAGGP